MPDTLPTADEFFGSPAAASAPDANAQNAVPDQPSTAKLPTADEFFGTAPQPDGSVGTMARRLTPIGVAARIVGRQADSQEADAYMTHSSAGAVLDAIGQGAKDGWGSEPLSWGEKTDQFLRDAGVFNDYKSAHGSLIKNFNEAMLRPAAVSLATGAESVARGFAGAFGGAQGGLYQGMMEAGAPQKLAADVAALPEAFPLYSEFAAARVLGVVGHEGENGWKGTVPPDGGAGAPPEIHAAAIKAEQAGKDHQPAMEGLPVGVEPPKPGAEAAPASPPDIHQIAAQIDPKVTQYRALEARRETFARWQQELQEPTAANIEAKPPQALQDLDAKIAAVDRKAENAGARLQDRYAAQLDDLHEQRADLMRDLVNSDPGVTRVRQNYMDADAAMRDMAPDVSAAYREAEARMGDETVIVPDETPSAPHVVPPDEPSPIHEPVAEPPYDATKANYAAGDQLQNVSRETSASGPVSTPEMVSAIAEDVAQKLIAAGRSEEEARLAGQLAAARVSARAEQMGGKLGSARDIYDREGPQIVAAVQAAPRGKRAVPEFANSKGGSITWARGSLRPLIKLFTGHADASTFIHESSHQWLEELMRDAEHPEAPESLKADARTVREYLKADETGPIKRAGHEKFARTGERYLMEGRAPTRALAQVFARFKTWLTQIYQTVTNLRAPITDDMRNVFDRLLSKTPEHTVIAPELPFETGLGDRHAALAEQAAPAKIPHLARKIRRERNAEIANNHPELVHELTAGTEGVEGGAASRASADGGEPAPEPVADENGGVSSTGNERPSGGQFKDESPRPRPEGARESKLYARVPKEPRRLVEFIKSKGGLQDEGGEVTGILGADRRSRGLVKTAERGGQSLEEIARSAWEEGYFPELGERQADPDDLLDKLAEDIRGTAQYSDHDRAEADAHHDALAHNHEVDRIANELAIDTHTMTRAQFWDKVAERLSEDHAAKEVESLDAARVAERSEIERDIEHHERHPEALEPEEVAAGRPGAGDVGAEQPGLSAGDEGAGQESAGQGGRGTGTAGGAGPENGEAGAGAEPKPGTTGIESKPRPVRDTDDPLIDKAGNIRLDNLNQPDDVDDALRQIARQQNDFIDARFGAEGRQFANLVKATRELTSQAMQAMADARERAALPTATEADLMAYQEASNRLAMVARKLSAITHDWGVAGHEFRMLGEVKPVTMAELAERTKGMTFNQLREEAQLGQKLETPAQQLKFINDLRSGRWDKARSMIIEYFVNSLISGPITHMAYTIGNYSTNLIRTGFEGPIAAAISVLRGRAVGERIYAGEAAGLVIAHTQGAVDGWSSAAKAWKTGLAQALPGEADSAVLPGMGALPNQGAIPGTVGRVLRLPSNGVAAIHSFGRAFTAAQELWKLAYRDGMDKGLQGAELDRHIAAFIDNPPMGTLEKVNAEATKSVLMQRAAYGTSFYKLKQFVESNLAAKLVAPFMQIGANLLHEAFIERTPLGMFDKTVRDNLFGRNGAIAQDMQMAKMVTGIGVSTAIIGLTLNGVVSGGGPSDPKQRAVLQATGWQPYSIRVGDHWIPYRKYLGYMGPLVAGAADVAEIGHQAADGQLTHAAAALIGGLSEVVADESWFRGVSNFVNAARNYDRPEGEKYLRDLALDFVPFSVGLGQIAHAIDPYSRYVHGWVDGFKNKIPGLSEDLMPRRDVLGEPIPGHLMTGPSTVRPSPVLDEMLKVGYYPSTIERRIRGVQLTDQQYDQFSAIAGRQAAKSVQMLMAQPGWESMPPNVRHDMIDAVFKQSRSDARSAIMMRSYGGPNDIIRQAVASKKKDLSIQR